MNNNDIFKKLRVALQLRDDQIVEILELVDFRMSKGEVGNLFRAAEHPNFVECGDQVLRNFLNGLVIHLRGTKESPKNALDVINANKEALAQTPDAEKKPAFVKSPAKGIDPKKTVKKTGEVKKPGKNFSPKKVEKKVSPVEKVKFNNGKKK